MRRFLLPLILALLAANLYGRQAVVEFIDGTVWIDRAGDVRARVPADFGATLEPGDVVATGPDGVAVVRLNDRSSMKLRENTSVRIDDVGQAAAVSLRSGGLFARVTRSAGATAAGAFQVRTPTVVAGVRGTKFFVAYGRTIEDEPDLWLCVDEGIVEVAVVGAGDPTLVEAGQGVNVLAGTRITDPRFYRWTTELNWNFDAAAGDVRDTTNLDGAYADLLDQDYD